MEQEEKGDEEEGEVEAVVRVSGSNKSYGHLIRGNLNQANIPIRLVCRQACGVFFD